MATFATSGVTASWTSSTNKGFYRGTTITIKYSKYTSSGPKYVYASSSASGGYSYKCTLSSTSNHTFTVAADTSTTSLSRTIYIIITDEYTTSTYKPDGRESYHHTAVVPRFVAHFYKGSSTKYTYNSADHEDLESTVSKSGYDIWGCNFDSSHPTCDIGPNWISYGDDLDGGTWYTVYRQEGYEETVTCYYYRGTSAKKTTTATITTTDKYLYGKGSTTGGKTSSDCSVSTSCLGDSSYKWIGFTTSVSSYNGTLYADPGYAYIDTGATTVYGVYEKEESMIYYSQNGTSSSKSSSVTNYIYGKGGANYTTKNIPSEPSLTYEDYEFSGWATTSNGSPDTWDNQWNNGVRTVYAIWTKDGGIYFGVGNNWVSAYVYKSVNEDGTLKWVSMSVDELMEYANK